MWWDAVPYFPSSFTTITLGSIMKPNHMALPDRQSVFPTTDMSIRDAANNRDDVEGLYKTASYEAARTQNDNSGQKKRSFIPDGSPTTFESMLSDIDAMSITAGSAAAARVTTNSESVFSQDDQDASTEPTELEALPEEFAEEKVKESAKNRSAHIDDDNNDTSSGDTQLGNIADERPGRDLCGIGDCLPVVPEEALKAFPDNLGDDLSVPGPSERQPPARTERSFIKDSRLLNIHRDYYNEVYRFLPGSTILYTVDYASFLSRGDAGYALHCLQTAFKEYGDQININFQFVEPGTKPITFQLRYKYSRRPGKLAASFFPVDVLMSRRPLELRIYNNSFDDLYKADMIMSFLHEASHILGGRHPGEKHPPYVQLDTTSDDSILASLPPQKLRLHMEDVDSLRRFYALPEGHKIDGYPIRNIDPSLYAWL
ncbi:hypothetical protein NPX13_g6316 [Xylaria arbuscula]|uniref:Peptidase metallopeptidase domain-containing protein n=1 Tax=Xylaria arbuscula TaxID=114810 RepID=A0A9W8NCV3_9PEZI|nr:hypothetical protein NPX13_g6316 [Xylaria arbuscula]